MKRTGILASLWQRLTGSSTSLESMFQSTAGGDSDDSGYAGMLAEIQDRASRGKPLGDLSGSLKKISDAELNDAIESLEAQGFAGRSNPALHALNKEQTDRLSTSELDARIAQRKAEGKPTGKLEAARTARMAGVSNMSSGQLRNTIKSLEAQGHTGRTNSHLHACNVAQTNAMSTGQIQATIAARRAEGKPTGKLEAALRDRGY